VKGEDGADIVKVVKGGPSGKGFKSNKTRSVGIGGDDLNLGSRAADALLSPLSSESPWSAKSGLMPSLPDHTFPDERRTSSTRPVT
jgi:hypothetical protein